MSDEARPALPPSVARPLAIAREWITGLSRPARVLLASTVLAAAVLTGWLVWSSRVETWGVLYSQLERDDAAALVTKLKELKVPYRLQGDGNVVEVPEARVRELRLELASAGLPRGGGVGFEAFDRMRLGATEFEQRVLFRRALEGELARTVSSLGAVQSARVHLVMPERSVFLSRNDPASASIVVRMRPGRRLGAAEVSGVVHLVASSVPSLDANRITLVTTDGEMLHRPRGEGSEASGEEDRSAQHRAVESELEERTRAMLERVVGEGHVDVRASVELDLARVERTEDTYNRDSATLRSEEQSLEHVGGAAAPRWRASLAPRAPSAARRLRPPPPGAPTLA
ncbi:MAG: flagellar basal-body MS-ring/collar protein FliF [Polyangiales bacterium]